MTPLSLVTVHHEGAGVPTDDPSGFQQGGYSYAVGPTKWTRLRSPYVSWATLNHNHISVDVCLSGNRMTAPVTDHDLLMLQQIAADARQRGELVDAPQVLPHKAFNGELFHGSPFYTQCPGDQTMARWLAVHDAFQSQPTPEDEVQWSKSLVRVNGTQEVWLYDGFTKRGLLQNDIDILTFTKQVDGTVYPIDPNVLAHVQETPRV